jgi:PAS domain S-box-containing protein
MHVEDSQPGKSVFHPIGLMNSLLDSITDIVFFKDLNGVYLGCNPPFARFVGRPKEEIVGKTDFDLFSRDIATGFQDHDRHALSRSEPQHNEEWITYPDGKRMLLDTAKMPYWGPDGALIGILGISRNITSQKKAEDALRDSESNFRTFFETIDDLVVVATLEGRILFTNRALERSLGYRSDELSRMFVLDLHPQSLREEAAAIFTAMMKGEQTCCPLPLASKSGSLLPVETRIWIGKWNSQPCLFGLSKDLSAEQEAKQRFERLFRNNPNPMALSRLPEKRLEDVNKAFLQTMGYSLNEVIGKTTVELGIFPNPDEYHQAAGNILAQGNASEIDLRVRTKAGALLDGLFSGELIHSQGADYLLTVMIDITDRKKAEREVSRLLTIQSALTALATQFVNVPLEKRNEAVDQSLAIMGEIIRADRAYLFSYDFARGTMSNTHEWCSPGTSPEIGNLQDVPLDLFPDWVKAHRLGESVHIPRVQALPEENPLRQILDSQGIRSLITLPLIHRRTCLGFVGFDAVREERSWETEGVSLLRVLAELYANFEMRQATETQTRALQSRLIEARDEAQEAARGKSLFLANMSHEIRTPLNAILGYAQIMERECRLCPTGRRLNAITRSGEHLLKLITDLLELARSDGHAIILKPKDFDFYQLLDDVRLMNASRSRTHALPLELVHAEDVPRMICADAVKIRQILVNLAGNAMKFTEKGKVVLTALVSARNPDGGLTLAVTVEDTGCGIQPGDFDRIFDLFEQLGTGPKAGTGSGLGLPLSRRYARVLGGDITVTSKPGSGSLFRFTFQARPANRSATEAPRSPTLLGLAPHQGPYRILAVDDDESNRDVLKTLLNEAGFAVETVPSAEEALSLLRGDGTIDMVLMDLRLPKMSGLDAIGHIRLLPDGVRPKVLVISASGIDPLEARAAGADGYVAKPVRRSQLLEEIGRISGLRFDYDNPPSSDPIQTPADLGQAIAGLAEEQKSILALALRRGDVRSLRATVDAIAEADASLAAGIRILVDAYDYDRLRQLLEQAKPSRP